MPNNSLINQFSFNYKQILIEEIALEGLEGIGINLLWKYVEKRVGFPLIQEMKQRMWNFIVSCKNISFYEIPEPRAEREIYDRFCIVEEECGTLLDPPDYLDGPYEYNPVDEDYGSCKDYHKRKKISKEDHNKVSLDEIISKYGNKFVMVASIEKRWQALAPHASLSNLDGFDSVNYCIMELVGRARENGQMTVGKTNLLNIMKDPKLMFYKRNQLQEKDYITAVHLAVVVNGKGIKCILLRLKRFHKPFILSLPKVGKSFEIIEYLKTQPNYSASVQDLMNRKLVSIASCKRLKKAMTNFTFETKQEKVKDAPPEITKMRKKVYAPDAMVTVKYLRLKMEEDEPAANDENEESDIPVKRVFKVGVDILRQAYELFLDSKLNGLSISDLANVMGIDFYTSRAICKVFLSKKVIRMFSEDCGRQRVLRYVAIAAAVNENATYTFEKERFLKYVEESKTMVSSSDSIDEEPPAKKRKQDNLAVDFNNIEELPSIDGSENVKNFTDILNSKKGATLRQLKFANGILKITRNSKVVVGYQSLSNLVAEDIGDTPMDTKALKNFLQRLLIDKQLKVFRLRWPDDTKFTYIVCAPNLTKTDYEIVSKYRDVCLRSISNECNRKAHKTMQTKKELKVQPSCDKSIPLVCFPRYMKVRRFHEFLIKFMRFEEEKPVFPEVPPGLVSLVHLIPEMSLELAIGQINISHLEPMTRLKINEKMLKMKLKEVPSNVYKTILRSMSLQNSLRSNLTILTSFGLLQLCFSSSPLTVDNRNGLLRYVIHVNKNASVIDTRGKWPRPGEDVDSLRRTFRFETFDDVKDYWDTLHSICIKTDVAKHTSRLLPNVPVRTVSELAENDNGMIYGDGKGAGGQDSAYHIELNRHWIHFDPLKCKIKSKPRPPSRIYRGREKNIELKTLKKKAKREVKKPKTKVKTIRNRSPRHKSTKWHDYEDRLLVMCKAAMTIMSPMSQPGCLSVRNMVAKDLIAIYDPKKTANNCHKRTATIDVNPSLTHERECIINECKRRRSVMPKYDGLLKKIRLQWLTNINKYLLFARIAMMELMWVILQIVKAKTHIQKIPCVAMNLDEFHQKFTIIRPTNSKQCNLYKTPPEYDFEVGLIKEGIMMAFIIMENETGTSLKIYKTFESYNERNLRIALEQVRASGAIAAKNKRIHYFMYKQSVQDIVRATVSYKPSASYYRRLISILNSPFVEDLAKKIDSDLPNAFKGAPDTNCLVCELSSCGYLDIICMISVTIAGASGNIYNEDQMNSTDLDSKFKIKSGDIGWRKRRNFEKFADVFPELDYAGMLQSLARECLVPTDIPESPAKDVIVQFILEKKEIGATFKELQDALYLDTKTLHGRLEGLEASNVVIRVGFYNNEIVHTRFKDHWSMVMADVRIVPKPWLKLDTTINEHVFMKWCGLIMNKIFKFPGCSVSVMTDDCSYLTSRNVQDICDYLQKCQCIDLNCKAVQEVDLFSDDQVENKLGEYNKYAAPTNIFVFPTKDCLTKYAYMRRKVLGDTNIGKETAVVIKPET